MEKKDNIKTILIVDDEQPIVDILTYNLKKEGYKTIEAGDGIKAINMAIEQRPDLILLDIMLPKMDGLTICKRIKNQINVPIIMLSAKDEEIDKILGLELGADDYITKPFSVRELVARVKANLRKADISSKNEYYEDDSNKTDSKEVILEYNNKNQDNIIKVKDIQLDIEKYEVKVRGKSVDMTVREFELLKYLALQPGQVVTREHLLERVWGYEYFGDIRTVDVTVRRIREKVEEDTSSPKILITKRGIGYYIEAE